MKKTETNDNTETKKLSIFEELIPAILLSLVSCFMLFIYEPIVMFANNVDDLWFDFKMMILPMALMFLIFFAAVFLILAAIYFINRRFSEKLTVYSIALTVVFVLFVSTYIQGNFLANLLPTLTGATIDWSDFVAENVITVAIWVILTALGIYCNLKMEFGPRVKLFSTLGTVIYAMLMVSLVTAMVTKDSFQSKNGMFLTNKNLEHASREENLLIFLIDGTEAEAFGKLVEENEEYKEVFEDFTFFPDTLGAYPCTRDTIPLILSGHLNRNEKPFSEFSTESLNNSPLFDKLTERGYEINIYDSDLIWYGTEKNYDIANSETAPEIKQFDTGYSLEFSYFVNEEMKYIGYKYLPFFMKGLSKIETLNFNIVDGRFSWKNMDIYDRIISAPDMTESAAPVFQFIHAEGSHAPFDLTRDMGHTEKYGFNYEEKIRACITMLNAYIERLKQNGVYDNSAIVIMADHGNTDLNEPDDMFRRANPLFMVKGIGEDHPYHVSDAPISYLELMQLYDELLDGKPAAELLASLDPDRPRTFMWYKNADYEDHMVEHVTTSKASDWEALKEGNTGREFDLG